MINADIVREKFIYCDGELFWNYTQSGGGKVQKFKKAGTFDKSTGYYRVTINRKMYYTHRVVFLYHHGYLPDFLDHIDNDSTNNRIENLRECTKSQNSMNRLPDKNSRSKYKGVCRPKGNRRWRASTSLQGTYYHIGYYDTEKEAADAYDEFVKDKHKEFRRLNLA